MNKEHYTCQSKKKYCIATVMKQLSKKAHINHKYNTHARNNFQNLPEVIR